MDIVVKYKIISKIINTNDESVLNAIKALLNLEEDDFWDELSANDKSAINEGLEQLDNGQYVTHKSLGEEIKNRFNF